LCILLLISVAVAAPKMARSIQRDKELETIHRGEQYRRAIQLYYRKFGNYPTSIDQLVETNQIRFLRKKYADPLTGKDDWKPVYFGHAHVRPLGFFGQPLMAMAGVGMAGIGGVGASMYAPVAAATDANGVPVASSDGSSTASSSPTNGSSGSSGLFGSSPSTPGTGFGSSPSSSFGSNSSFGNSSSPMGGSSTSPMGGSTFGSTSSSPGTGTSATTFGGTGPIVGFTLPVKKPSLIDYMKQTSYDHWEFNYDPMADQAQAMAGLAGGAANPNGANGTQNGNSPSNVITQPPNNGSTLMSPDNSTTNPQDNSTPQPQQNQPQ
ncbi:MAG: hypothetical protein WCB76_00075, partial [Acidobacteriaceae bacterium]